MAIEEIEKPGMILILGILLLQLSMFPFFFAAMHFWSKQQEDQGWYMIGLGWFCFVVSKILAPKKSAKEKSDGSSGKD